MDTQTTTNASIHPLAWAAGIAVIIFSTLGIGALMGWIPNSIGNAGGKSVLEAQAPASSSPVTPKPVASRAAPVVQPAPAPRPAPVPRATVASLPATPPVVAAAVAVAKCTDCGVIESVREIDTKGEGTGIGVVGGAVAGGLLGSQVGGGRGKDVMAVVGAVGGGFAGNEVEKRMKSTKSYSVTVRLEDGTSRSFSSATLPPWQPGEKIRIVNGAIQPNS